MTNGTFGASVRLSYLKIRDVSTKAEEDNGASTYVAVLPAVEILKIGTDGNLRSYIPAHEGKKRNLVHKAIARTITDKSDQFSQLNSGFLIGASKIVIDDNKRVATLSNASVNNGAQSQGEIRRYFEECEKNGEPPADFAIRCELSIEPDDATRTDIAVARNTATRIEGISIAGKHGYFDELNKSFQNMFPKLELARSETNVEDHFVDTRQLLQVLWAMMPRELEPDGRKTIEARMRAYKNAAFCLQDFIEIVDHKNDPGSVARYSYFIDMAGVAWNEYQRWRTHPLWNDKRLYERLGQAVRDDDGQIKEISDGIVFPILSALSRFMKRNSSRSEWQLVYPTGWEDEDLLLAARRQLKECDGRPMLMGRSGSAYEALMTVTEMAVRLADRYSQLAASAQQAREAELAIARLPFNPALLKKIKELDVSVRSDSCLKDDDILYVGDLVRKTEAELLRTPDFGRKCLYEIKEMLAHMGLHLGMEVPGWPPENIDQLAEAHAARAVATERAS